MSRRIQLSMMNFASNKKRTHDTSSTISSSSEPQSKKSTPDEPSTKSAGRWDSVGNSLLVYTTNDVESRSKIAGFDMDGTLISTKSGNVFPKDVSDWKLWSAKVSPKLQQLHADGYKIVIFTNQRGIEKGLVRVNDFKNKIINVSKALKVPLQAFVSTGPTNYRKPYPGMWIELESHYNDGVSINRAKSLYCGDAAGRLKSSSRKADHSGADRSFALNLGVQFMTPEQLFLNEKREEPYKQPGFVPTTYLALAKTRFVPSTTQFPYNSGRQELVIMVGAPASGKSFISKMLVNNHGYSIVNQDTLGTKKACETAAQRLLTEGKRVVIDNTNRDPKTREFYIKAAKARNVRCRAVIMDCDQAMAKHNNTFREILGADDKHKGISTMVYRMYFSAYSEPTRDEGFDDLIHCNFVPEFVDENSKQIYSYILDD